MENTELAKVRAESRVRLLAVVLLLLVLAGGVREYMAMREAGAEATVIYARGKSLVAEPSGTAKKAMSAEALPESGNQTATAENMAVETPRAEAQNETAVDGAAVFLNYLNQVNHDLEGITKPESALEKIVAFENKAEEPAHEVIFEDGRIEIYDSEAGVIAVEETGVAEDETPMQAVKADEALAAEGAVSAETPSALAEISAAVQEPENGNQPVNASQPEASEKSVENTEESPAQVGSTGEVVGNAGENKEQTAEEDGAIDMMKEIATRAEEEAKAN